MLLNLSDILAKCADWFSVHFAEVSVAFTVPAIIWFLLKLLLSFIKNKQAIKSAVLDSVKTLNNGIAALKDEINIFKEEVKTQLSDFETKTESKIDGKFDELRERRKEIYNNIMAGIDKIENKTIQVVEKTEEEFKKTTEEIVEKIEEVPEPIIEPTISEEDILR